MKNAEQVKDRIIELKSEAEKMLWEDDHCDMGRVLLIRNEVRILENVLLDEDLPF